MHIVAASLIKSLWAWLDGNEANKSVPVSSWVSSSLNRMCDRVSVRGTEHNVCRISMSRVPGLAWGSDWTSVPAEGAKERSDAGLLLVGEVFDFVKKNLWQSPDRSGGEPHMRGWAVRGKGRRLASPTLTNA